jgi:Spy/CpxP family protein refolding chaperone
MENVQMKKSILFISFLIIGLLLTVQYSAAGNKAGCGQACKGQKGQGQQQQLDPEAQKKYEKFLEETVDLRKELDEKMAEYQALMASNNPDPSKGAMLTEEYYQLRDVLTQKAKLAGIAPKRGGCNGCNGGGKVACGLSAPGANVEKTN